MDRTVILIILGSFALSACGGGGSTVPSSHTASLAPSKASRLPFASMRASRSVAGRFEFLDRSGATVGFATNDSSGATFKLNGQKAWHYTYDRTSKNRTAVVAYVPHGVAVRYEASESARTFTFFDRNSTSAKSVSIPIAHVATQDQSVRRTSCNGEALNMFLASLANFAVQDLVTLTGITLTNGSDPNAIGIFWQPNLAGPSEEYYFSGVTLYVDPVSAELLLGDIANNNAQVWSEITDDIAQYLTYQQLVLDDINDKNCVQIGG